MIGVSPISRCVWRALDGIIAGSKAAVYPISAYRYPVASVPGAQVPHDGSRK